MQGTLRVEELQACIEQARSRGYFWHSLQCLCDDCRHADKCIEFATFALNGPDAARVTQR